MRSILLALLLIFPVGRNFSQPPQSREWHFISNQHLKVGIDLNAGACIGWISTSDEPDKNILNTYDRGRYLQQSYYGDPDGSDWNGKPWRYNPVQGGDWRNRPSEVLEFKTISASSLHSKTRPRHWASGNILDEVVFSQTLSLKGELLHVIFEIQTTTLSNHQPYHQELPALFVQPEYDTLLHAEKVGAPLSKVRPGEKNSYLPIPEYWVAWTNSRGQGIAIFSPSSDQATCYRVPDVPGTGSGCSYAAPIATFALKPNFRYKYEIWLGIGDVETLRKRFRTLMTTAESSDQR